VAVAGYACPSDPDAGVILDLPAGTLVPMAADPPGGRLKMVLTSYSASYGSFYVNPLPRPANNCTPDARAIAQANGAINDVSPIRFASIGDGLGQTLLAAEKSVSLYRAIQGGGGTSFGDHGWYVSGNWGDTLFTTFYPVNMPKKVAATAGFAHLLAASSQHPAGVNGLMGDGSVRFIKDTIDSWPYSTTSGAPPTATSNLAGYWENLPREGVWQAISTRSGGETVAGSDF